MPGVAQEGYEEEGGVPSLSVVADPMPFTVLVALQQLTGGDGHDSVPQDQLRLESGASESGIDEIVSKLVVMGLVERVSITEDVTWVRITVRGVHVVSGLTGGSR